MKLFQIIKYHYLAHSLIKKHGYKREPFEDRDVLERIIFPYVLSRLDPGATLDIGREDYQAFYNEYFTGRELWTMDIDPQRAEFGAKNHLTANAADVGRHFPQDKFDFVLMNGVLNWGLNKKAEAEKCLNGLSRIMKPGALLVIGWNDFKDIKVIKPGELSAISRFQPYRFPPLKTAEFKCINGEHVYNFYMKKNDKSS